MTKEHPNIEQNHWQEWLADSVDPGIITLNVRSVEGELSTVDGEYYEALAEFLNIPIRPRRWINRQGFKNLAYSFQLLTRFLAASKPLNLFMGVSRRRFQSPSNFVLVLNIHFNSI
jgi:hypothetical protein